MHRSFMTGNVEKKCATFQDGQAMRSRHFVVLTYSMHAQCVKHK